MAVQEAATEAGMSNFEEHQATSELATQQAAAASNFSGCGEQQCMIGEAAYEVVEDSLPSPEVQQHETTQGTSEAAHDNNLSSPVMQQFEADQPAVQTPPNSTALSPDVQQFEAAVQEAVSAVTASDSQLLQSSEQGDGLTEEHHVDGCACRLSHFCSCCSGLGMPDAVLNVTTSSCCCAGPLGPRG